MRILAVSLGYPKYPGEQTTPFMDGIVKGLLRRGHAIDVVLPHHPEFRYPQAEGLAFHPYRYSPIERLSPWGFGNTFTSGSRVRWEAVGLLPAIAVTLRHCLRRLLSTRAYDVVHAHWVVPNGWLAASPARRHGVPLVITMHGSDVALAERYKVLAVFARRAFHAACAVTATSDDLRRRAIALGADSKSAYTIHIGVDSEHFAPRVADETLRRRLGADDGAFLVVAVGRLASVKGFEYLIDAAPELAGATISIVGDGELRAELEARARSSGAKVVFTGGLPHDRIADVMCAADAVVVPSIVDRMGRVDATTSTVPEALSCGRPLVATRVGGIPELVEDGQSGLLVEQKDPHALAEAITRLQRDEGLRRRLSEGGRNFAVTHLNWDATAEAFEQIYRDARTDRA